MGEKLSAKITEKLGFKLVKHPGGVEVVNLKELQQLKMVLSYFFFLLLTWGLYRFLFRFPEEVEELFLKPFFWLGSLFWLVKKVEKKSLLSLGLKVKDWRRGVGWALSFSCLFVLEGIGIYYFKYGQWGFPRLNYSFGGWLGLIITTLVTAITEEVAFRGFIFNRLWRLEKREGEANWVTSVMFALIYLPITIFVFHYSWPQVLAYGLIAFLYSLAAGFVFARSESVVTVIWLHLLWSWPIIIFQ